MKYLRWQNLSPCRSAKLPIIFDAAALHQKTVLEFSITQLRVTFSGDATVWGDARLLS